MSNEKEKTVCNPLVGASGRQSIQSTEVSIPHPDAKCNRKILETKSMAEIYDTVYLGKPPLIDGLLYPGTYLFAGAPKLGKSFLMAQIAYHISVGLDMWGFPVRQGTVLYLALEDDYHRLQERLYRMFGTDSTDNLHFAIKAPDLENGLDEQLENFIRQHPDTSLIIIDTLQKIREVGGEKYSYANDYEIVARMKEFADKHCICLLLVHHTRKQTADDKFDMISGTTGLLGAADGAFLLQKKKRTSNAATLDVSGRDQPDQKLYINRNSETLQWELEEAETELWQEPPDPLLALVQGLVTAEKPSWSGTATQLAEVLQLQITPIALAMRLNVRAGKLMDDYHIHYENTRTHAGRTITLTLI